MILVFVEVKGALPNKQRLFHERRGFPELSEVLEEAYWEQLHSQTITGAVLVEINLFFVKHRYVRLHNNEYIGDIDNLLGGVIDALKGLIITDDDLVMELIAKKHIITDEEKTRYTINVIPI